jgi:glycosyltransferase involved in cell wall biosynthesis
MDVYRSDPSLTKMNRFPSSLTRLQMRIAGRKLRNAYHVCKLLPRIFATGGGLTGTSIKALRVLRLEGLDGIKQRILYVASIRRGPDGISGLPTRDYREWARRYDSLTDSDKVRMRHLAEQFATKPVISVVMPVFNPKPEWLVEAIESIYDQIYTHWELCIADDASTDPGVREVLDRYKDKDARIKILFREKRGHISASTNSAISVATGEYIAFLDHDDKLAENALFWIVDAINRRPDAVLIYSDEDKLDEKGRRLDPYFKCDWNYDLFLSQNFIAHLAVYRSSLVIELGGCRQSYDGSQDYDLVLRCIERLRGEQIVHIPRILYHWRQHSHSTAASGSSKSYAHDAGFRAIADHLHRKKIAAEVLPAAVGMPSAPAQYYRIRYALPERRPLTSLIIPTRNGLALLRQCIESILGKTNYPNYEILIVDNASDEPEVLAYFESLKANERIRILRDDRPFNYAALNNRAVSEVRGDVIGLVNNDVVVISPDWLTEMVSIALQPGVGAVGARLWYPDETLQHGGVILGLRGVAGHSHKRLPRNHPGYFGRAGLIQSMSALTAACLVIRRNIYLQAEGMDENNLKIAFNDVDFCLKVKELGYRNIWTPYAELYHHESATRREEDNAEKKARFAAEVCYMQQRWGDILTQDPAYNANLTLQAEDFSLAWPPRVAAQAG